MSELARLHSKTSPRPTTQESPAPTARWLPACRPAGHEPWPQFSCMCSGTVWPLGSVQQDSPQAPLSIELPSLCSKTHRFPLVQGQADKARETL